MKTIVRIQQMSGFIQNGNLLTRKEIEYYSDGTSAIAFASYEKKEEFKALYLYL
jgi:hypothetical protein